MPLLSIVIPVHNVENYIEECLKSILNQNFNDYEVILVNDASTDRSGEICDEYASKYKNIKVIHLKGNSLPGGARNAGLKKAEGEYIHFCDSDDYYLDNVFSYISENIKKSFPTVLLGQFISLPEKGAYVCKDVKLDPDIFISGDSITLARYLLGIPNFLCTVWRFIVKREFLMSNNIMFPEGCISEDEEWVIRMMCSADRFALLTEPFYCYRPRAYGSLTSKKTYLHSKSKLIVSFNLLRFLKCKKYEDFRKELIYSKVNMLLGSFATRCDTFNSEQIQELADIIEKSSDVVSALNQIPDRRDLYCYINNYGAYKGLSLYCEHVVNETLRLVHGKEDKDIFIFPTGNNGESTARILQNAGYNVKGFFDNSRTKNNCIINTLPVRLPGVLKDMSPEELENIFVVVTNQQRHVANEIMDQLRGYGLNDSQFVSRIY